MNLKQLPWLASALSMTAGLYLLAGPFQTERSGISGLLSPWVVLNAYEFTVIGMIGVLHRREAETTALSIVAIFFLLDPIFLGDAFASTDRRASLYLNGADACLGILKAWALARARNHSLTPWLAGQVAAAIGLIHVMPSLIAGAVAWPAFNKPLPEALTWGVAALSVPLARSRWLGWAAIAGLGVHFVASGLVVHLDFRLEFLTAPQLALACLLPWPRYGWMPLPGALYCSALRPRITSAMSSLEGVGWFLVAGAFFFLGLGFARSLRKPPAGSDPLARSPRRGRAQSPAAASAAPAADAAP